MTHRHERILTIYFLVAGIIFLWLYQPVNGYDSPPEKVRAGDTLYEYVSDKFGHNSYLTRFALENFPKPYTHKVRCESIPDSNCYKELSVIPEKNVLLANTSMVSKDGDTIETQGREIIITKPSGEVDRLLLVSSNQLAVKKYTQFVQNLVLLGFLVMAGIVVVVIGSPRRHKLASKEVGRDNQIRSLAKKLILMKEKLVFAFFAVIVATFTVMLLSEGTLSAFVMAAYFSIFFVGFPVIFLITFFGVPLLSFVKGPKILPTVIFSLAAGLFGTAAFYILEVMITNGRF